MNKLLSFLLIIFSVSCSQAPQTVSPDGNTSVKPDTTGKQKNYRALLTAIHKKASGFRYTEKNAEQIRQYFYTAVNDSVFPYWYGTTWDFNGATTKPGTGAVACGYFVTTVLRDAGIALQRIKLAQQPASVIIDKLCEEHSIKHFSKLEKLQAYLNTFPDKSIFILGLDCHVGFVVRERENLYFVHSNYTGKKVVEKQAIALAPPVVQSKSYMVGCLSGNGELMRGWTN